MEVLAVSKASQYHSFWNIREEGPKKQKTSFQLVQQILPKVLFSMTSSANSGIYPFSWERKVEFLVEKEVFKGKRVDILVCILSGCICV